MVERHISSEMLYSSLSGIRGKLLKAIGVLGLPTTQDLCYQINYSIVLGLQKDLNIPAYEYNLRSNQRIKSESPYIGYVGQGRIKNGNEWVSHSFPLIFGIEDAPILVDGANDQRDLSNPFLIQKLGKSDYNSIASALKKQGHRIVELSDAERHVSEDGAEHLLGTLNAMKRIKKITEEDAMLIMSQINREKELGLYNLFLDMNRNLLKYFTKALGIDYPSIQEQRTTLIWTLKNEGISLPQPYDSDIIRFDSLAKRLKEEGLI